MSFCIGRRPDPLRRNVERVRQMRGEKAGEKSYCKESLVSGRVNGPFRRYVIDYVE